MYVFGPENMKIPFHDNRVFKCAHMVLARMDTVHLKPPETKKAVWVKKVE